MQTKKSFAGPVVALAVLFSTSLAPAEATFTILGPFPIITTTYGVGTVPLIPPTTNSPAPWVFTSSDPKVAIISGRTITVVGAGTSTITASQAAKGVFTARARSTQIRVAQGTPVLGAFAPQSISITQRTFTLTPPTSTSDGGWAFMSSNPLVASVDVRKVTVHAGGTTIIYANQSPTTNWKAASVYMKLTVVPIAPVLGTFGDITIMKDNVASINLLPPKSSSNGAWTFTGSNPSVASVIGNVVTPLSFGTTQITATQAAIGDYGSASATMTLSVQGPLPTVGTFPDVIAPLSVSHAIVLAAPTSTSSGAWTFTSSDSTVATVSGQTAMLVKPGTVTITASQAATSVFASPNPVSMKLTIVGTPTIGPWSDIQKVVKDPNFSLTPPESNSPGAWTFSSSNPAIADVVNGVVSVKGSGEAVITATQAATPIWQQASAKMTIRVFGAIPTLGAFAPIQATVGDGPTVLKPPSSNSLGTWTFSLPNRNIATISGSTLTIVGEGTTTISATQNSAGIYSQSNTVQTTLTVKPKPVATPTPTPKSTPSPTTKPTPSPTPTSTVKPTSTPAPGINQTINATASGRVINVVAIGVKALVWINGKPAKVGKNTVKPGLAAVVITISDRVVYRKNFTIK